jgi:hypothetical protein
LHTRAYAMENTFQYIKSCQHKLEGWKKNYKFNYRKAKWKKNKDKKQIGYKQRNESGWMALAIVNYISILFYNCK